MRLILDKTVPLGIPISLATLDMFLGPYSASPSRILTSTLSSSSSMPFPPALNFRWTLYLSYGPAGESIGSACVFAIIVRTARLIESVIMIAFQCRRTNILKFKHITSPHFIFVCKRPFASTKIKLIYIPF